MDWGLGNRLAKIITPTDGRAVMLAIDHGYFLGPTERLEDPRAATRQLLRHCDSLMLTRGVLRNCIDASNQVPIVLRVSGGSSIIGEDLSCEDITVSIRDAIRLNATAVTMSIFVGAKYEQQTIVNLGRLVNEANEYGFPVLAVTAVGKDMGKDARYLSLACRIAAEQGAHIVKTYYCENFERVVGTCPVPVIVAGGKKIPERDALALTYNAVSAGAAGVDMGRNIWQSDNPVAMIRAVRAIVHGNLNSGEAYALYQKLAKDERTPGKTRTDNAKRTATVAAPGAKNAGRRDSRQDQHKDAKNGGGRERGRDTRDPARRQNRNNAGRPGDSRPRRNNDAKPKPVKKVIMNPGTPKAAEREKETAGPKETAS